jgi:hypothetical protein
MNSDDSGMCFDVERLLGGLEVRPLTVAELARSSLNGSISDCFVSQNVLEVLGRVSRYCRGKMGHKACDAEIRVLDEMEVG